MYRSEQLGGRRSPRLGAYVEDLIAYLETSAPFLSESLQASYVEGVLRLRFGALRAHIVREVGRALEERESLGATHAQRLAGGCVNAEVRRWSELDSLESIADLPDQRIYEQYGEVIDRVRDEVFEKLPLSATAHRNLSRLVTMYFKKDNFPPATLLDTYTGVVVAGYGDEEIFPVMFSLELDGMLLNRLRYRIRGSQRITPDVPAIIQAFAQQEMVNLFMEGVDPAMRGSLLSTLHELLSSYPAVFRTELAEIPDAKLRHRIGGRLRDLGSTVVEVIQARFEDLSREAYWGPIVQAVSALPKDQLAAMAEALINLTSFKRRMSVGEAETVGGPIDVAVISKGDGFVWIRRKHYFRPELNPQFFENYFHDAVGSTREEVTHGDEDTKGPDGDEEVPGAGRPLG